MHIDKREGHAAHMTELADLIQAWLDEEPSRKVPDLARASGLHRNVIYDLRKRQPKEPPRRKTLQALADGLEKPYAAVRDAAYRDAGQRVEQTPTDDPSVLALVAFLTDATPQQRAVAVAAAVAAADALDHSPERP